MGDPFGAAPWVTPLEAMPAFSGAPPDDSVRCDERGTSGGTGAGPGDPVPSICPPWPRHPPNEPLDPEAFAFPMAAKTGGAPFAEDDMAGRPCDHVPASIAWRMMKSSSTSGFNMLCRNLSSTPPLGIAVEATGGQVGDPILPPRASWCPGDPVAPIRTVGDPIGGIVLTVPAGLCTMGRSEGFGSVSWRVGDPIPPPGRCSPSGVKMLNATGVCTNESSCATRLFCVNLTPVSCCARRGTEDCPGDPVATSCPACVEWAPNVGDPIVGPLTARASC